jgi:hypothetical protein
MTNQHLIGKQTFDLQFSSREGIHEIQHELSRLYWQRVTMALERLFDELAPPTEKIRIDKLEIDLGVLSLQDLTSGAFIEKLLIGLEQSISNSLSQNTPTAIRQPIHLEQFELWLCFLETGAFPTYAATPASLPEWHRHIFDTLALDAVAVERLRKLLSARPLAFERLILQFDTTFQQQIIRLHTGHKHDELPLLIRTLAERIALLLYALFHAIQSAPHKIGSMSKEEIFDLVIKRLHRSIPALKNRLQWAIQLKKWLLQHYAKIVEKTPQQLQRQFETEAWRIAFSEVILQQKKVDAIGLIAQIIEHPAMAHWQPILLRELNRGKWNPAITKELFKDIKASLANSVELSKSNASAKTDDSTLSPRPELPLDSEFPTAVNASENRPDSATGQSGNQIPGDVAAATFGAASAQSLNPSIDYTAAFVPDSTRIAEHYLKNAGLVLLHTFLPQFFRKSELLDGQSFKSTWHQQKAIYLLHYLSTGTVEVPEFQLILPKLLCGLPLNMPLDHQIFLSDEERNEAENLLEAVIEHWGVLGSTSPDGLREGFLQRDGRLEKRATGWFLKVENQTLDILLDRLPWNLSLIKLPWMEELLKVEWR